MGQVDGGGGSSTDRERQVSTTSYRVLHGSEMKVGVCWYLGRILQRKVRMPCSFVSRLDCPRLAAEIKSSRHCH